MNPIYSRINGKKYELFVHNVYGGDYTGGERTYPYDMVIDDKLIQVKGAQIVNDAKQNRKQLLRNPNQKLYHNRLGRYKIYYDSHVMLFLKGLELGKIPVYVFVLKLSDRMIYRELSWEVVENFLTYKSRKGMSNIPITVVW